MVTSVPSTVFLQRSSRPCAPEPRAVEARLPPGRTCAPPPPPWHPPFWPLCLSLSSVLFVHFLNVPRRSEIMAFVLHQTCFPQPGPSGRARAVRSCPRVPPASLPAWPFASSAAAGLASPVPPPTPEHPRPPGRPAGQHPRAARHGDLPHHRPRLREREGSKETQVGGPWRWRGFGPGLWLS